MTYLPVGKAFGRMSKYMYMGGKEKRASSGSAKKVVGGGIGWISMIIFRSSRTLGLSRS